MNPLAELVLTQQDVVYECVTSDVWKDKDGSPLKLWVRSLTSTERDGYEESLQTEVTKRVSRKGRTKEVKERKLTLKMARAKLVALCVCEGDGKPNRVFTDGQVSLLSEKNGAALDQLADVAMRLSRITDDSIEDELKN